MMLISRLPRRVRLGNLGALWGPHRPCSSVRGG